LKIIKTVLGLKRKVKMIINLPLVIGRQKIFCISMQRNGTTSVGNFLSEHGYRVARNGDSKYYKWTYKWHIGDFEGIFRSAAFRSFQAFEDDPWWMPDLYKILYHRFPKSRFILFYRDSDKWFDSMLSHSNGKTLGNTRRHCKVYNRMTEFYHKVDNDPSFKPTVNCWDSLMSLEGMREHYKRVYDEYNREAIEFFQRYSPESLFVARLEDRDKWQKLARFLGFTVNEDYDMHAGKSTK